MTDTTVTTTARQLYTIVAPIGTQIFNANADGSKGELLLKTATPQAQYIAMSDASIISCDGAFLHHGANFRLAPSNAESGGYIDPQDPSISVDISAGEITITNPKAGYTYDLEYIRAAHAIDSIEALIIDGEYTAPSECIIQDLAYTDYEIDLSGLALVWLGSGIIEPSGAWVIALNGGKAVMSEEAS